MPDPPDSQPVAASSDSEGASSKLDSAQLVAVFHGNPIPTFIWRHDQGVFRLVDFNRAAIEWSHGAVKQFIGQSAERMFGDMPEILAGLTRCVELGEAHSHEMEYRFRSSPRASWLFCTYSPVPPDLIAVATLDITERVMAERALHESRERYRRLYDNALVGLGRSQIEDGKLVECNRQLARMLGYDDPDHLLRERGHIPYADESDKERLRAALAGVGVGGTISGFEARYLRRDGTTIWGRSSLRVAPEDNCIEGVALDITEWKEAEERLRLLATVVEVAAESIVITDVPDRRVEYCNPAFCALTGYTPADAVGQTTNDLLEAGHNDPQVLDDMRQAVRAGRGWMGRLTGRRKDGTLMELEASFRPVQEPGGPPRRLIIVLRDVTHEVRLEQQLEQARKMEAIGRLAGGIAHDFNNLLTAIIGHTQLSLGRVADTDPSHDDLVAVRDAGERAARLTRQLLEFSRPQPVRLHPLDLNDLLRGMERMIGDMIASSGSHIELQFDLLPGQAAILGDRAQVERVVMNLVGNAVDAMHDGGKLTIAATPHLLSEPLTTSSGELPPGPWIVLDVSDTGSGMTPDVLEQMFEPFFTTKPAGAGTGLGLATVHGIVRQLGGGVTVTSGSGQGSNVRIWLPRADPSDPRAQSRRRDITARYGGAERVLLVEDEPAVRRLVQMTLELQGYRVQVAGTAEDALAGLSAESPPELLLTDLRLPGMDGRQLALAARERIPDLPVLFVSGHPERYIAEGESGVPNGRLLQKPFTPVELLREVRLALDATAAFREPPADAADTGPSRPG